MLQQLVFVPSKYQTALQNLCTVDHGMLDCWAACFVDVLGL
jgi:hypothetical protein